MTKRRVSRTPAGPDPAIYELEILLQEVHSPVWRRVLVPAGCTLGQLHEVVIAAMGWWDSHLHCFRLAGRIFGNPIYDPDGELGFEDERRVRLQALLGPSESIAYEYDFGDSWTHTILVKGVLRVDPRMRYPLCIAGERACPPEDCGGPPGYQQLCEVLSDPSSPEHDEMLQWVGGFFDPSSFDVNAANRALRATRCARALSRRNRR